MASVVIDMDALVGPNVPFETDEDDGIVITFSRDPVDNPAAEIRKFWGLVLLMSLRDRATSIHYHPWRGDSSLAYIVENTRYELLPPPAEYAADILRVARSMFLAPERGFFARLFGRDSAHPACSAVSLDSWGKFVIWDVVFWTTGERSGLELYRITPLEDPPPAGPS